MTALLFLLAYAQTGVGVAIGVVAVARKHGYTAPGPLVIFTVLVFWPLYIGATVGGVLTSPAATFREALDDTNDALAEWGWK